jgi:hypothetical protein
MKEVRTSNRAIVGILFASSLVAGAWACSSSSSSSSASSGDAGDSGGSSEDASSPIEASSDGPPVTGEAGPADSGKTDGPATSDAAGDGGWVLTFSDEFNESSSTPDPSKWVYWSIGESTAGPGWGLEYDTPSADVVQNGNLVITGTQAADGGILSGSISRPRASSSRRTGTGRPASRSPAAPERGRRSG